MPQRCPGAGTTQHAHMPRLMAAALERNEGRDAPNPGGTPQHRKPTQCSRTSAFNPTHSCNAAGLQPAEAGTAFCNYRATGRARPARPACPAATHAAVGEEAPQPFETHLQLMPTYTEGQLRGLPWPCLISVLHFSPWASPLSPVPLTCATEGDKNKHVPIAIFLRKPRIFVSA